MWQQKKHKFQNAAVLLINVQCMAMHSNILFVEAVIYLAEKLACKLRTIGQ